MQATARHIVCCLAILFVAAVLAPTASASITPALSLDQSAGTSAGSTVPLGLDLKFAPSGSDSPKDLTLTLPAGLLADASVNGGACLRSAAPVPACQVGTGTVTATTLGLVPVTLGVSFDLVAPPKAGDLAGIALMVSLLGSSSQLGAPGEISVRTSSSPAGVGLNIIFTNLPNSYLGVPISVDELQTSFSALRLPASCPATPASVQATVDSYSDPTAGQTATAPLHVSGCSQLAFTAALHVAAAKDPSSPGVQITSDLGQPSTPVQSTSRTVKLAFPSAVLSPNVAAVLFGGILCSDLSSGRCKPVGTATAISPLYPTALTGTDYLVGSLTAPSIAIVFPAPFPITLNGKVDLASNSTTFDNIPDIPLTSLAVALAGGPNAVFATLCSPSSGTAAATLTSQNGDRSTTVASPFAVSGCSTSPLVSRPPTKGSPSGSPGARLPKSRRARITAALVSGLAHGRPRLGFGMIAGTNAPKLQSFTIELPRGLSFRPRLRRIGRSLVGVVVGGAEIRSATLQRGRLVVRLRRPAGTLLVAIGPSVLLESRQLEAKARHQKIRGLKLTVLVHGSTPKSTTFTALIDEVGR